MSLIDLTCDTTPVLNSAAAAAADDVLYVGADSQPSTPLENEPLYMRRVRRIHRMYISLVEEGADNQLSQEEIYNRLSRLRGRLWVIRNNSSHLNASARRRLYQAMRPVNASINSALRMVVNQRPRSTEQSQVRSRRNAVRRVSPESVIPTDVTVPSPPVRASRSDDALSSISRTNEVLQMLADTSPLRETARSPITANRRTSNGESVQCPVCLESLQTLRSRCCDFLVTKCGHWFCKSCLMSCLSTARVCPVCRTNIARNGQYHPIFF